MKKKGLLICVLLILIAAGGICYAEDSSENLRIIRGNINYDGSKDVGDGFTSSRNSAYSAGVYYITPTVSFSSKPTIVVTPIAAINKFTSGWWLGVDSHFEVVITNKRGVLADSPFSFIIIGPQ